MQPWLSAPVSHLLNVFGGSRLDLICLIRTNQYQGVAALQISFLLDREATAAVAKSHQAQVFPPQSKE